MSIEPLIQFALSALASQVSDLAAFTIGFLCLLIFVIKSINFFSSTSEV